VNGTRTARDVPAGSREIAGNLGTIGDQRCQDWRVDYDSGGRAETRVGADGGA
jgi:hypothetical protein